MYTGFKPSVTFNKSLPSVDPTETQLYVLQRYVDNYTRKLEQYKRKNFTIQDSYRSIFDYFYREKQKLNELKKYSSKAITVKNQATIKNLEATLKQAISTYDDTIAHNSTLKQSIDKLRRYKRYYQETQLSLYEQIKKYDEYLRYKSYVIDSKKKKAEYLKEEIVKIKMKNEKEREECVQQFYTLEKYYLVDKKYRENLKFEKLAKPEAIDTQPLLKHRLKRMAAANRQKIKMIEEYKQHMLKIESAFTSIKNKSNIQSLEYITTTFIKCEYQNYSLYNYMDELSRSIDALEESNQELEKRITEKKRDNQEKRNIINYENIHFKNKTEIEEIVKRKYMAEEELKIIINALEPALRESLIQLSKSKLNDNPSKGQDYELAFDVNERNIYEYLSDFEQYINILLVAKYEAKTKVVNSIKDSATPYSRPLPLINYDEFSRDKIDSKEDNIKFIEYEKLRVYANEYWYKRRNRGKYT